jgi:type I restriction enzyme R subunit
LTGADAVNLKTFLKAGDRVNKVARFVSDHFRQNVEPLGYKAFLVGVDREACALYKNALDKYLPPEYSAVVYTSAHNDSQLLAEFKLDEDEEKRIRRAFIKRDNQPKILIVTEKLLTGFDAPILYCMYLDKPMRDHTLLQAIARVNRPYEDEDGIKKPAGYVLDFVGIFEKLERALAFDSDIVGSAIQNIDVLKHQFATLMDEQAPPYLALCSGPVDDKTLEKAIDVFEDKERREAFYKLFKELEMLYEIISPDVFLRPHIENYGKLSLLYQIVTNAFSKKVALIKDLMRKTEDLVKRTATGTGFELAMKVIRIDENTVEALKTEKSGEPPKVINLGKSLLTAISEEAENQPYLIPIGERTEAILEGYDDRQITTQSALQQLAKLMEEYLQAKRERDGTGFDINTFTLFWVLKQSGAREADHVAPKVDAAFRKYPNYRDNVAEERQLKAEVYKLVLPAVGKEVMVAVVKRLLELQRS